jgi:hypothetical protein
MRIVVQIPHKMPILSDMEAFLFLAKNVKMRYNQGTKAAS